MIGRETVPMPSSKGNRLRLLGILLLAYLSCSHRLSGEGMERITLEAAIDLAKTRSRELAQIRSERELAGERLRMEARRFFPSLAVTFSKNDSVSYGSPDSRLRTFGLSVTQLVYDRGELLHRYRQHRQQLMISGIAARQASEDIALAVTNEYITLLVLRASLDIRRSAAAALERQVDIAEREQSLGLTTVLDVLQIRLSLTDFALEISSTERRRDKSRIAFARLLHADPDTGPLPVGGIATSYRGFLLEPAADSGHLRDRLVGEARQNNTELLATADRLEAALLAKKRADRAWIPELKATAELSISGERFPLTEPGYRIGLEVAFGIPAAPISAGASVGKASIRERSLGTHAAVRPMDELESLLSSRAASLEVDRAGMRQDEAEQEFRFRIHDLLSEISHMRAALDLDREKLGIARARLAILHERARLGEVRRLEVAESELAIARQETAILEAAARMYRTEISILLAVGNSEIAKTVGFIVGEEGERE